MIQAEEKSMETHLAILACEKVLPKGPMVPTALPLFWEGKLEIPLASAGKDSPPSLECPLNISTPTDQPFPLSESFSVGGVGHH